MTDKLTLNYMRETNKEFWEGLETGRGLKNLEAYVGPIKFLHGVKKSTHAQYEYVVRDVKGKEILRKAKQKEIAEYFNVSLSTVSTAILNKKELKECRVYKEEIENG